MKAGDRLVKINQAEMSGFEGLFEFVGGLREPATLTLSVNRGDELLKIKLAPEFCIFPHTFYTSGVEFNKFCDSNCDCTIDQSGWLCVTFWVYAGEGPNGGVLMQKRCGSQQSGLPTLFSICSTFEFF